MAMNYFGKCKPSNSRVKWKRVEWDRLSQYSDKCNNHYLITSVVGSTKITQRKGVTSLTSSALLTFLDLHGLCCDLTEMASSHLHILEQHKDSTSNTQNIHGFICVTKYLCNS